MPIMQIEIVGDSATYKHDIAHQLADAAGIVLASRPQGTWVKLHFIPTSNYAENAGAPEGVRPVFVSVIQANPPSGAFLAAQVSKLADAISEVTGHPVGNVHIVMEPSSVGRVAFGGKLVE